MFKELSNLRRRPYVVSEFMLAGFLFFFLVLSGPRFAKLATLCGGLSVLFFVFELLLRSQIPEVLKRLKPLVPYSLFVILAILVLPLIPYAYSRVWNLFTGILILTIAFSITRRFGRAHILEYAFPMVVLGLCFLMLVAPGLVGAEASTESVSGRVNYRATGLGEGGGLLSSHFSVIVGISIFLSLMALVDGSFHIKKLITLNGVYHLFSTIIGFYLVVMLSGSRQGLLWWFFAGLLCYAIFTKRRWFLGLVFIVPVVLVFLGAGYFFFQDSQIVQRVVAIFDPIARTFDPEKSFESRIYMIQIGLDMWKESPVWGNGNEAFRVKSGLDAYSHNNYIEILVNYGFVGLILFYAPLITALIVSIKGFLRVQNDRLKNDYLWVAFAVIAILASNMFMPSYYMKHMLMFIGVVLGRLYYLRNKEKGAPEMTPYYSSIKRL